VKPVADPKIPIDPAKAIKDVGAKKPGEKVKPELVSKENTYEEKNTLEEINDQFNKKLNIKKLNMEGYGNKDAVSMGNLLGEELGRVYDKFPKLKDILKENDIESLTVVNSRVLRGLTKNFELGDIKGAYTQKEKSILLAGGNKLNGNITTGGWSVESSLLGTARHEFGHAVHYTPKVNTNWDEFLNKNPDVKDKGWWASKVSQYGATNKKEAFSEAFTAFTHSDYGKKGGKLPSVLDKYFTDLLIGD